MSQPEPDLETQKRRHAGPLIGIVAVLAFVAVILTWWFGTEAVDGNAPAGAETQIDGRTGDEEPQGGTVGAPQQTPEAETTTPVPGGETTTAPTSPPDGQTPPAGSTNP